MLAIFDMEGVLVDGEFLPELAKVVGKGEEAWKITLQGIKGEINWEEGLAKRIELVKGVSYDVAQQIADQLPLMVGAKELFQKLKMIGCKTISVTGGFNLLADRIKRELDLDFVINNDLIFEKDMLTGYSLNVNSNKAQALQRLAAELREQLPNAAIVIDGFNDLHLFSLGKIRVAFNAQEAVKERADYVINTKDLRLVIPILVEHFRRVELKP